MRCCSLFARFSRAPSPGSCGSTASRSRREASPNSRTTSSEPSASRSSPLRHTMTAASTYTKRDSGAVVASSSSGERSARGAGLPLSARSCASSALSLSCAHTHSHRRHVPSRLSSRRRCTSAMRNAKRHSGQAPFASKARCRCGSSRASISLRRPSIARIPAPLVAKPSRAAGGAGGEHMRARKHASAPASSSGSAARKGDRRSDMP
mmetsp:Transcript_13687/g.57197  ORF Transcript_13687/g.57197 Transcript_13687/m.57197 type:complete len:208 (+) Transcript_13687:2830-3453(+)